MLNAPVLPPAGNPRALAILATVPMTPNVELIRRVMPKSLAHPATPDFTSITAVQAKEAPFSAPHISADT